MIRKILSAIEPNRVKYEKLFQYRFKIDAFAGYWLQHLLRGDVFSKLDLAFKRVQIAPWLARKCPLPVVPAHGGWWTGSALVGTGCQWL
jgi:hypothetical protein